MTTHYHVGSNVPGYLPENDQDGPGFAYPDVAFAALVNDIARDGDALADDDRDSQRVASDLYALAATCEQMAREFEVRGYPEHFEVSGPASSSPYDLGRAYWIAPCSEECEIVE